MAHREGVLTTTSLLVGEASAGDAAERAHRNPGLRVGLHVAVCEARPTLPPREIPALVNARGELRHPIVALLRLLVLGWLPARTAASYGQVTEVDDKPFEHRPGSCHVPKSCAAAESGSIAVAEDRRQPLPQTSSSGIPSACMSVPRVLVTGGAGFIGSHVAERFAREGWAVRVLDDLSTGDAANCHQGWELRRGDVCDAAEVAAAVEDVRMVVHLAAFTSVPESFERFEECYRSNVWGSWNVFDACAVRGVDKLVFASSSAVYAELPDAPKSEADCPEPISPYAVSKLEAEHLLDIQRRTRGLASAALRFFNVYGPRQPADSAYAAAIPIFLERGLAGRTLTIYGDGHQTRDFVYVTDVAEAVFRCAVGDATGVLNVGTGVPIEVRDLADRIVTLTGGNPEYRFEPLRPGDVRSSTAAVARSAAALGWVPDCPLEKGLAETLAWWRARAVSEERDHRNRRS